MPISHPPVILFLAAGYINHVILSPCSASLESGRQPLSAPNRFVHATPFPFRLIASYPLPCPPILSHLICHLVPFHPVPPHPSPSHQSNIPRHQVPLHHVTHERFLPALTSCRLMSFPPKTLKTIPCAPVMGTSSSADMMAPSALSWARFLPLPRPMPIIAVPAPPMTDLGVNAYCVVGEQRDR